MDNITFQVTRLEADLIAACLGKQPYETTAPLIHKLQSQYASQVQTPEAIDNAKDSELPESE